MTPLPASTSASAPPRISVVVPTCGRPRLLMRCLRALREQTLPASAYEVLVVDDGCSDSTRSAVVAYASRHPSFGLRYLRPGSRPRRGPAAARNAGWRRARGALMAFTDDDTIPAPDWLAAGERAMACGDWVALAGRVHVPPLEPVPTDHERMTRGLEHTAFVTANAFVRRDALERIGGFDERFTRAWREDSDLQFRLLALGPVGRCEAATVQHPVRPERWGVSLRQQRNAFFEALLYAKHPQRYREELGAPVPWNFYAIVALSIAALGFGLADATGPAAAAAAGAGLGMLRFALRRLAHTSHRPAHVLEMLATSALIPFQSVYWRLRGALHFRVWFL